ncbi:MAG: hypothetical protein QOG60_2395 [Frankiaceae bacterium]|nr:hypothetical protein [Frankiaceae bacterium]
MSSLKPAAAERALLVDLLRERGPAGPTLCAGWGTAELAAHLVTRESDPVALAGILVPPLHTRTEQREAAMLASVPYERLLQRLAVGPPFGLVGLPGLADTVNVHEFFVHHEDVRRATPGWEPRQLPTSLETALRRRLVALAPLLLRAVKGVRLHLRTPTGPLRSVGRGADEVTLIGEVPELFLYAFGRKAAAQVSLEGPEGARATVASAPLGL